MRKSWLFGITLVTLGVLAGTAGAGAVPIKRLPALVWVEPSCLRGWVATMGVQTVVATGKPAQFLATNRGIAKVRAPVAVNADNAPEDLPRC